jgi:RimJ/RimL family protein N-acetyltransferase
MNSDKIPMDIELTDGEILIRPYKTEDISVMFEAVCESIPEISAWLEWCHADYTIEEAETFIKSRPEAWEREEEYSFAVFDAKTKEFLGGVGLNLFNRRFRLCNLGYWLRTSATGRSIASKATRLVAKFALTELGLNRIEIVASVKNIPSQRAAEKAGAKREGILRKALPLHGEVHDCIMYSLIAEDFEKND